MPALGTLAPPIFGTTYLEALDCPEFESRGLVGRARSQPMQIASPFAIVAAG